MRTDVEMLKAQLALWKGIARSRERQNQFLAAYGDLMADIAEFWKGAEPEAEMPPELVARIDAFQSENAV